MFIDDHDMTVYSAFTVPIERVDQDEENSPLMSLSTRYGNENRFKFINTLSTKTSLPDQSYPCGAEEMSPILIRGRSMKMSTPKGPKKLVTSPVHLKVTLSSIKQPCQFLDDDVASEKNDIMYKTTRYKSESYTDQDDSQVSDAEIVNVSGSRIEEVCFSVNSPDPQFLSNQYQDKSSRNLVLDLHQQREATSVNGDKDTDGPIDTVIDHLEVLKNDGAFMDYMQTKILEAGKIVPDQMTPARRRLSSVYLVSMPHKPQSFTFNR